MNQVILSPTHEQQNQLDDWLLASHTIFQDVIEMQNALKTRKWLRKRERKEMTAEFKKRHKLFNNVPKLLLTISITQGELCSRKVRGKYIRRAIQDEAFCTLPMSLVKLKDYSAKFKGIDGKIPYTEYDFDSIKSAILRRTSDKQYIIEVKYE